MKMWAEKIFLKDTEWKSREMEYLGEREKNYKPWIFLSPRYPPKVIWQTLPRRTNEIDAPVVTPYTQSSSETQTHKQDDTLFFWKNKTKKLQNMQM